jgi:hypothetical protein
MARCFNLGKSAVPDRIAYFAEAVGTLPVCGNLKFIERVSFHFM